jgi:hypothetical protein
LERDCARNAFIPIFMPARQTVCHTYREKEKSITK